MSTMIAHMANTYTTKQLKAADKKGLARGLEAMASGCQNNLQDLADSQDVF
jgi:hypothetical protein